MNGNDYISLNVPGLLTRFSNPTPEWRAKVLAFAATQLSTFEEHGLISAGAEALRVPIENAVVRFSDYTALGQQFVKTGAVDKWLASCDRKGEMSAYSDPVPLAKRIKAFLASRGS